MYFYLLLIAFATITWGKMFISIFSGIFLLHWIVEGNYKQKLQNIKQSKGFIFFLAFFLILLTGLLYSRNIEKGLKDLLTSLPLLIFPLTVMSRKALSRKQIYIILYIFLASLSFNTFYCIIKYHFFLPEYTDARELSRFMSHIRFSLYLNMGIAICVFLLLFPEKKYKKTIVVLISAVALWLVVFQLLMHSMTGIISLVFIIGFILILILKRLRPGLSLYITVGVGGTLFLMFFLLVYSELRLFTSPDVVDVARLDSLTAKGNRYEAYKQKTILENGHYNSLYICESECIKAWDERSDIPYRGRDAKNQFVRLTLFRYLTSKNLRKDYEGIYELSDKDIKNIEAGLTNYRFENRFSPSVRVYEVIWEIDFARKFGNNDFHSFTQRFEFYRCALMVIKDNLLFGVGTGDLKDEMQKMYRTDSFNIPESRRRMPHSQFLTFLGRHGIVSFILLCSAFCISVRKPLKQNPCLTGIWIILVTVSMLNEDTLNNFNGVAFFALFGGLLLSENFSQSFFKPDAV